jgi:hypothetical protein
MRLLVAFLLVFRTTTASFLHPHPSTQSLQLVSPRYASEFDSQDQIAQAWKSINKDMTINDQDILKELEEIRNGFRKLAETAPSQPEPATAPPTSPDFGWHMGQVQQHGATTTMPPPTVKTVDLPREAFPVPEFPTEINIEKVCVLSSTFLAQLFAACSFSLFFY